MIHRFLTSWAVACSLAASGFGALQPNEIAIIGARGNQQSEGLARYYARVRGVPADNICLVDMPAGEVLPHETWKWAVRPEIHKWLVEHDPEKKIRCLLTVWGVPLKISPAAPDDETRKYEQYLRAERLHRLGLLTVVQQNLDQIASTGEPPDAALPGSDSGESRSAPSADEATAGGTKSESASVGADGSSKTDSQDGAAAGAAPPKTELERRRAQLEQALRDAQKRLTDVAVGENLTRGQMQLQQLATAAGGANVLLQGLNREVTNNPNVTPALRTEFDALRGRAGAYVELRYLLDQMPPGFERDAIILSILERNGGLFACVEWLDEQIKVVTQNETGASFDSELALVLWPDNYQLLRWQPNYLRPTFDNSQLSKAFPTFMVARLDAPTLLLAKGLVDTAMKVEREGLRGKVYVDGRGLAKLEDTKLVPGSYNDYDRALLVIADGIKKNTEIEVVLDTSPQLFQPGTCKDAMLYCGWYSLAKYVDAFDWSPGAVAYHLASGEANSLRDPSSQVWCKKLLEDGVCATIGPVYEPYLVAFPRPNEFFGLLLQGELTLVECYARTSPFNSWMMTLIGDPLYRPFKYRTLNRPSTAAQN